MQKVKQSKPTFVGMSRKVAVYRKERFNAAHRLHNPALSDEENARIYGKCNLPNYHGHNYELVVEVTGEVDERTGFVIDTKMLSQLVQQYVTDVFDHRNLNLDIPALQGINPTTENVAIVIFDILRPHLDARLTLKIFLCETERNFVAYPA